MDVDTIHKGEDFRKALDGALSRSSVLLAIIGRNWLHASDENDAQRIFKVDDFVRLEIATALKADIPIIPVLVDGSAMPSADRLPDDIKLLASKQAAIVSHDNFPSDMDRLERDLRAFLPGRRFRTVQFVPVVICGFAIIALLFAWYWRGAHQNVRRNGKAPSTSTDPIARLPPGRPCKEERGAKTPSGISTALSVVFSNQRDTAVNVYWLDVSGNRQHYFTLDGGQSRSVQTYVGHIWIATDAANECVRMYIADQVDRVVQIR